MKIFKSLSLLIHSEILDFNLNFIISHFHRFSENLFNGNQSFQGFKDSILTQGYHSLAVEILLRDFFAETGADNFRQFGSHLKNFKNSHPAGNAFILANLATLSVINFIRLLEF